MLLDVKTVDLSLTWHLSCCAITTWASWMSITPDCDVCSDACDVYHDTCDVYNDAYDVYNDACDLHNDAYDVYNDACDVYMTLLTLLVFRRPHSGQISPPSSRSMTSRCPELPNVGKKCLGLFLFVTKYCLFTILLLNFVYLILH
jgi:hypothetical protein